MLTHICRIIKLPRFSNSRRSCWNKASNCFRNNRKFSSLADDEIWDRSCKSLFTTSSELSDRVRIRAENVLSFVVIVYLQTVSKTPSICITYHIRSFLMKHQQPFNASISGFFPFVLKLKCKGFNSRS